MDAHFQDFEKEEHIWSDTSRKSEKELVNYDVEEISGEDDVIDSKSDYGTTENCDEDHVEVYDNNWCIFEGICF